MVVPVEIRRQHCVVAYSVQNAPRRPGQLEPEMREAVSQAAPLPPPLSPDQDGGPIGQKWHMEGYGHKGACQGPRGDIPHNARFAVPGSAIRA